MATLSGLAPVVTLNRADRVIVVQNDGTVESPVWVDRTSTVGEIEDAAVAAAMDLVPIDDAAAVYAVLDADHRASRRMTNAAAKTVTVTPDSTGTAKRAGYRQDFYNWGAADITFVAGAGVTVQAQNGGTPVLPQYGAASLVRMAANVYLLVGSLTPAEA